MLTLTALAGVAITHCKGKVIEDFLLQSNLTVLNNGSSTYLHPGTGSTSTIDFSVYSLFLDLKPPSHGNGMSDVKLRL